ncbi:hypothetical protein FHX42_003847 [Saccharopolyspora lacisalsi]|uniref:Uncharacterized protein n=1 Tax=Halosaccharopolyspora lacisalsi TaxID=1000566 RepID=A0A839E565_9PSEU|nr:hypothetical protein [Halosaccharopolyspora lacisalsi]MBA8826471.1 hypothetical protein [Halosaccharopolyspora lacisalsi]
MIVRWAAAINWRYALLASGFAVLATMRFGTGATAWGLVFAAAAAVNGWLAVHERQRASDDEKPMPSARDLTRSWKVHRGSLRRWRILACVAVAIGAGLLAVDPVLGLLAAATALLCLLRARRVRRDTDTLRQALSGTSFSEEPS